MGNMDQKEKILQTVASVYREKGFKFTMDDIAQNAGISKKTIYVVFEDKEQMFLSMVEYLFDQIKESEHRVVADQELDTLQKIRKILGVLPEGYRDLDFSQLYVMKEKYPRIYEKIEERMENGWEQTIQLLKQGMEEGVVRPVSIPVVKAMFEASLEQFFRRNVLQKNKISYQKALQEVVDILIDGIRVDNP